jgi:hypothetical protein
MSKGYIVYPQGDFDGNAFCVDADSAQEAAYVGWAEHNWSISCVICVLPFEQEKRFLLTVEVDNDI